MFDLKKCYLAVKDKFNYIIKETKIWAKLYPLNPNIYKLLTDKSKSLFFRLLKDTRQTLLDIKEFLHECLENLKKAFKSRYNQIMELVNRYRENRVPIIKKAFNDFFCGLKKEIAKIVKIRKRHGIKTALDASRHIIKSFYKTNKRFIIAGSHVLIPITSVLVLICTVTYFNTLNYGLIIQCNGQEIGKVRSEKTIEEVNNMINKRIKEETSSCSNIEYTLGTVAKKSCLETGEAFERVIENSEDLEKAVGLYINNKLIGAIRGTPDVQTHIKLMLQELLDKTKKEFDNSTEISFNESTEIIYGLYPAESIITEERLKQIINGCPEQEMCYDIKQGDTVSSIAKKFNMSEKELQQINKFTDNDHIYEGQKIKIKAAKSVLNVKVIKQEKYNKVLHYKTITEKSNKTYKGYSKLVQKGEDGTEEYIDKVTYVSGVETERENISRKVLKKPVDKKIIVGTKKKPKSVYYQGSGKSTGKLSWPLSYTRKITSPYGSRWGRMHWGVDISSKGVHGKAILAADGGVVSCVKSARGGYGNYFIIDHGNGISTLYAHCSRVYVHPGQRVSKGQAVGAVGNSGRSTGSHLHFEVSVKGSRRNPLAYLR